MKLSMSWRLITQSSSRPSCMGSDSSLVSTSVQRRRTSLGVGVWLVAGVDDRARRRGGAGDLLADVLGPLRQAVVEPARRLEHLAGPGEDLPGHEEGDEGFREPLERDVARDQIVLVAAVG